MIVIKHGERIASPCLFRLCLLTFAADQRTGGLLCQNRCPHSNRRLSCRPRCSWKGHNLKGRILPRSGSRRMTELRYCRIAHSARLPQVLHSILLCLLSVRRFRLRLCSEQDRSVRHHRQRRYLVCRLGQFTRNYTQTTKRGLLTTNKG